MNEPFIIIVTNKESKFSAKIVKDFAGTEFEFYEAFCKHIADELGESTDIFPPLNLKEGRDINFSGEIGGDPFHIYGEFSGYQFECMGRDYRSRILYFDTDDVDMSKPIFVYADAENDKYFQIGHVGISANKEMFDSFISGFAAALHNYSLEAREAEEKNGYTHAETVIVTEEAIREALDNGETFDWYTDYGRYGGCDYQVAVLELR